MRILKDRKDLEKCQKVIFHYILFPIIWVYNIDNIRLYGVNMSKNEDLLKAINEPAFSYEKTAAKHIGVLEELIKKDTSKDIGILLENNKNNLALATDSKLFNEFNNEDSIDVREEDDTSITNIKKIAKEKIEEYKKFVLLLDEIDKLVKEQQANLSRNAEHNQLKDINEKINAALSQAEKLKSSLGPQEKNDFEKSADKVRKIVNQVDSKLTPLVANFIMEKDDPMGFTDDVVDEATFLASIPKENQPEVAEDEQTSISQENSPKLPGQNLKVTFQGTHLQEGKVIRSSIDFEGGKKGLLKQDHNGKVSNYSSKNLEPKQRAQVAMKQVKMLLANYDPEKGNVILRGHNNEMGQAVYAALLVVANSGKIEGFNKENIDVRMEGIKPSRTRKPGTWFNLESKFIHEHLTQYFDKKSIVEQFDLLKNVRTSLKDRLTSFKEGEEVDSDEPKDIADEDSAARPGNN